MAVKQNHPSPAPASVTGTPDALAQRNTGYLRILFGLLMTVTIFEGYDLTIFYLCTPAIARTFHMDDRAVGLMSSIVRFGGMLAFFVVMLSDRYGRKPVVKATVVLYTLFTLLTALARGLWSFTLFQSCAQIFLAAEFGVATIMISEEFPDNVRGRGIAGLNMAALVGVVAGGYLYGKVVDTQLGWRGMYLIGILPLLLVAFLRRNLKETARFEALRQSAALAPKVSRLSMFRQAIEPFGGPYRGRLLLVATLWNSVFLVGAPALTFFSLHAKRDLHWTSSDIGRAVVLAYLVGALGPMLAGWAVDRIGRKFTTSLSYLVGAAAVIALFQSARHEAVLIAMVATVFAFQGARTATGTYSAELFPTEIRATSYSIAVQFLGQITAILSPFLIGVLSKSLGGLGNAVTIVAVGPVVGAILVWLFAPETRGMRLEELSHVEAAVKMI